MINNLPKSWNDISLEIYQELHSIKKEDKTYTELLVEQISLLLDIAPDDEYFDELDIDELINIINNIKWIKNTPSENFSNVIDNLNLKDINKMTLGEFIDLEHFFKDDYIKNLHLICSILYKQYEVDKWNNKIEEPYIYNIYERSELYLKQPIHKVFGVIKHYLDFKDIILDTYKIVFESDDFNDLENTEGLSDEEIEEIKKEIEEDKKKAVWSWDAVIYNLCDGDITKSDNLTNLSLIYILNTLSMKKILKL
jgi:predicted CopG family antitoxin